MKKIVSIITVLTLFTLTCLLEAQAPQRISYQSVVRNTSDDLVKNTGIGMQISILQGSGTGPAVYVERHFPTTSPAGLVTVEIGSGILVSGSFSSINWSSGTYYIKSEIDLNGGASYTISGTSQILSVPYALHAKTSEESDPVWSGAAGNYYTKTNVQTAGQATIDAANISTGALSLTNGGTGATTAAGARANLELGSLATLSTVTSSQITDGTIVSLDIADGTISTTDIQDGTIGTLDVATDALTASDIAADAIGASEIAADAVGASEIAADAVTASEIAAGAVGTSEIADGTVTSADIATDAITAADIAADAITASEIAAGAVGTSEIADGTITTADVSSIDASKISGITSNNIPKSDGTGLTESQIYDNGTTVRVGSLNEPFSKLTVNNTNTSSWSEGIYVEASGGTANVAGVFSVAYTSLGASSIGYGIRSFSSGNGTTNYGTYSRAYTGIENYGIYGQADGTTGSTCYGVYGTASLGTTNWAGYFNLGNIHISNQIEAPNLSSSTGTALVIDASGWIRKSSSDMRLKENITPLQNMLDRVLLLKGVNFTWRSDDTHSPDIGFIAQDVQKIFPELVVQDKNDGMLSVKYMNMTAVLTEAIKELHKELEEAKKEIEDLRRIVSATGK